MVSCHQPRPITHVDGKAIIVNLKPPNRAEIRNGGGEGDGDRDGAEDCDGGGETSHD